MTRVRSAAKPISASPRVAAPTAPGASITARIRNHGLRMDPGAKAGMRQFRGTLDSGGRGLILGGRQPLAVGRDRAMSGRIEARLKELGIELPQPASPVANYVPFATSGNLV